MLKLSNKLFRQNIELVSVPASSLVMSNEETEYQQLAKELDIPCVQSTIKNKLLNILSELNLEVYDREIVHKFMASITPKDMRWKWFHLRLNQPYPGRGETDIWVGNGEITVQNDLYQHPIPIEVLRIVKQIEERLPGLTYLISNYAVRDPDPFLAVWAKGLREEIIIYHWDEPGFTEFKG